MRVALHVVVAFTAVFVLAGTARANEAGLGAAEETATAGPEAAAVLLGTAEDDAVAGSRAASVLLSASQTVETHVAGQISTSPSAKLRNGRRAAHSTLRTN
jgi:hypothetical protein